MENFISLLLFYTLISGINKGLQIGGVIVQKNHWAMTI